MHSEEAASPGQAALSQEEHEHGPAPARTRPAPLCGLQEPGEQHGSRRES